MNPSKFRFLGYGFELRIGAINLLMGVVFLTGLLARVRGDEMGSKAGEFHFSHHEREIRVLTHQPKDAEEGRLLILFHGATRDADSYFRSGKVLAERMKAVLAVPEFDRERFDPEAYQEGGVMHGGQLARSEDWTFGYVRPLIEEIPWKEDKRPTKVVLVGHSAGAQFVNRMAALAPEKIGRMVVVSAGSLVFPTRDLNYPYGFGGLPEKLSDDDAIRRYLAVPMTLYIGTADNGTKRLPMDKSARQQGADRVERTKRCYEKGRQLAAQHGWDFGWRLVEAEGLDHSSEPMWKHPKLVRAMEGAE